MRALIVITGAFAICACGDQSVDQNAVNTSDAMAAEAITSNDTTAIDAATGDAANMAADVDYTIGNSSTGDVSADGSVGNRTAARRDRAPVGPAANGENTAAPMETATDTNEI